MKRVVYGYEAQKSIAKETIKKSLKKILDSNENFTKKDIEMLLR